MKICVALTGVFLTLITWLDQEKFVYAENGRAAESNLTAIPCPDVVPRGLALFGPQVVYPGESLRERLVAFARNIGTDSTVLMNAAFYISGDSFITTSDRLLVGGREAVRATQAGFVEPVPIIGSMTVPVDWPHRPAYLGIIVDEMNDMTECNESNNTAWIAITVAAPAASVLDVPGVYDNIADAITAAVDGDTIRIAAGEYDEPLAISKDLVFQGAGADVTRLETSTDDNVIVSVAHASVVFSGIEFYGSGAQPYFVSRGITATNSSIWTDRCKFTNIVNFSIYADSGDLKLDSTYFVVAGIVADAGVYANSANFTIRNCYGGTNIDHIFDPRIASLGVIENCTIDGSPVNWANGIRVRDQTAAVLRNNVIVGQHTLSTPPSLTVGGIAVFGSAFVEIDGNAVTGFTYGMNLSSGAAVRAHGNNITENLSEGIVLANSAKLDLGGGEWNSPGCNDIYDNGTYNVRNGNLPAVYAKNNDWGTGDAMAIDAKLYDDNEDAGLGQVIYSPFGACTPVGLNVMLWLGVIQVVFGEIQQSGVTTVVEEDAGPPPPPGYQMFPPNPIAPAIYYNINTSALYSGEIEVCLPYSEGQVNGSESLLRMFHYQGDAWRDVTTTVDIDGNVVCGRTTSLSGGVRFPLRHQYLSPEPDRLVGFSFAAFPLYCLLFCPATKDTYSLRKMVCFVHYPKRV